MRDSVATEQTRRAFMPETVRVLFVGESAPAGPTFFYDATSNLFRRMRAAMNDALGTTGRADPEFLEAFKRIGCYLDDLCLEPVNDLPRKERAARCISWEPDLARRLSELRPEVIVAIGKTYAAPSVKRALKESGVAARFETIPFPNWPDQQAEFHRRASDLALELLR